MRTIKQNDYSSTFFLSVKLIVSEPLPAPSCFYKVRPEKSFQIIPKAKRWILIIEKFLELDFQMVRGYEIGRNPIVSKDDVSDAIQRADSYNSYQGTNHRHYAGEITRNFRERKVLRATFFSHLEWKRFIRSRGCQIFEIIS